MPFLYANSHSDMCIRTVSSNTPTFFDFAAILIETHSPGSSTPVEEIMVKQPIFNLVGFGFALKFNRVNLYCLTENIIWRIYFLSPDFFSFLLFFDSFFLLLLVDFELFDVLVLVLFDPDLLLLLEDLALFPLSFEPFFPFFPFFFFFFFFLVSPPFLPRPTMT